MRKATSLTSAAVGRRRPPPRLQKALKFGRNLSVVLALRDKTISRNTREIIMTFRVTNMAAATAENGSCASQSACI